MNYTGTEAFMLIADASLTDRQMIADLFKNEYTIITASNGVEVMRLLDEYSNIAVALIDADMPECDGFSVLEKLQEQEEYSRIPVFTMVLSNDSSAKMRAYNLGSVGVLDKPINSQVLYHQVSNILKRLNHLDETGVTGPHVMVNEFDEKTGMYGRAAFCKEARKLLDSRKDERFVLFRWDIDGFKVLNDVYGIEAGDRFLAKVGAFYKEKYSHIGIHGRWESDHFVSLVTLCDFNKYNVVELITSYDSFDEFGFELVTRVGVYIIDDISLDVSLMCDRALMALKSIKDNYVKRVALYDDSMREELIETQQLVSEMRGALERGEFIIYLQPQYNYSNHSLHGAEALVRWLHPKKGLIPPIKFIPIFERNGFISHVDKYVWEECCKLQRKWIDMGYDPVPISVNVSRLDIYTIKLSEYFTGLIRKYGLTTESIRIEITESAYIDNPAHLVNAVEKLQAAGFSVEMDDFGSGASSLNTLKDVPVDMLKLDMKFIESTGDNTTTADRGGSILSSVVRMSNWLKLPVLAEGVESKAQADYLKSIGCVYMQGYYFAKPMPVDEYEKLLSKHKDEPVRRKDFFQDETDMSDAYEFFNASTPANFMFNSFVGGAAVVEYDGKTAEAIRLNEKFTECLERRDYSGASRPVDLSGLFDAVSMNNLVKVFAKTIDSRKEEDCQLTCLSSQGKTQWIHARIRLLAINSGRYLFYLAIENISRQMSLMMSNKHMVDQLASIVSSIEGGICEYEVRAQRVHMIYCNEEFPAMLGFTESEFMALYEDNPYAGICPDDLYEIDQGFTNLRQGTQSMFSERCRHICRDGSWKWISIDCSVTRKTDRAIFCTGIIKDRSIDS